MKQYIFVTGTISSCQENGTKFVTIFLHPVRFPVRAGEGSTNCEIRMQIYLRKLCFSLASSCFCCRIIIIAGIAGITAVEPKVDKVHLTIDISPFLLAERIFFLPGKPALIVPTLWRNEFALNFSPREWAKV